MGIGNLGSGPSFSLTKTETENIELSTSNHGTTYFVDAETYNSMRYSYSTQTSVESSVDQQYYKQLQKKCKKEKEARKQVKARAQSLPDDDPEQLKLLTQLDEMTLDACNF